MSVPPQAAPEGPGSADRRAFTVKALVLGLLLAPMVVVAGWFNDQYLGQTPAIGNFLPALPFGLALVVVLGWNPTFGRWRPLRFSPREAAVVFALTLLVAWLPMSGFLRYFQRAIVTAQTQAEARPEWRQLDILGHMPEHIFPHGGAPEVAALRGAIAAERTALAAGTLAQPLAGAGVAAAEYAAALDLAALVPPRQWPDRDQGLARENAARAWQRVAPGDAAVGALLAAMPASLAAEGAPPAWRLARGRLDAAFAECLPAATRDYERVYTGMLQGLPEGDEPLPLGETPLRDWLPALAYWLPLVLLFTLSILMLQLIVHRQWSHHEQLTYPIAAVASSLLRREGDALLSDIFRQRLFWFGAAPILFIHLLNYLAAWNPGKLPSLTMYWNQADIVVDVFPSLVQAGGLGALGYGAVYFTVIGLAFFISSEVSFTMGISGFAVVLFNLQFYTATGATTDLASARCGAYLGYALILLYTGRTYYWGVVVRACGRGGGAGGEHGEAVWAARLFLLAFAGFTAVLVGAFGLDWFVALAYAATLMVFFLVFTRVVCETGIPFLQAGWQPAQLLASTLGISAIGAAPLVMVHYLGTVLSQDPRECLMPFAANALRLAEDTGVRRLRLAALGFAAIALALAVGLVATLWGMYNFGSTGDGYANGVAAANLGEAARGVGTLVETGQYAATTATSGLGKLPLIAEGTGKARELSWIGFGMVAVAVFSLIRFRWVGFYLHPVLFLIWDTYPASRVWLSFLIGWIAKELVVRFGGGRVYQGLKPLFIGLIAGEIMAVMISLSYGWIYHLATGLKPVSVSVFAG